MIVVSGEAGCFYSVLFLQLSPQHSLLSPIPSLTPRYYFFMRRPQRIPRNYWAVESLPRRVAYPQYEIRLPLEFAFRHPRWWRLSQHIQEDLEHMLSSWIALFQLQQRIS